MVLWIAQPNAICAHMLRTVRKKMKLEKEERPKRIAEMKKKKCSLICVTHISHQVPRYTSFWWKMIRNCQAFDTDGIFSEGILTHSSTFYYQQIKPFSAWFVVYVWFLFALGLSQSSGLTLVFFFLGENHTDLLNHNRSKWFALCLLNPPTGCLPIQCDKIQCSTKSKR